MATSAAPARSPGAWTVAENTGATVGGVYAQSLGATATTFTGNRGTSTEGVGAAGAIYGASNPPNPVVSFGYNLVGNAKGCSWSHPATAVQWRRDKSSVHASLGGAV